MRAWIRLAVVVLVSSGLWGCGGGDRPTQAPVPTAIPVKPTPAPEIQAKMDIFLVKATRYKVAGLQQALDEYHADYQRYPTLEEGLVVLAEKGAQGGPYTEPGPDAWQQPFRYRPESQHGLKGPDVWSAGPDGVDGTADDIGNWQADSVLPATKDARTGLPAGFVLPTGNE